MTNSLPIMVTGASGLVGRALVEALGRVGRPVLAVDRVPPPEPADYSLVPAELTDVHRLNALVAGGVHGIIHCGGVSGPMLGRDHPAGIANVNIGGTVNLLEAARVFGVTRFVFCSSIAAYGDTPPGATPVRENAPLAPTDIYGASKAAGDLMVRAYAAQHDLDARIIRIGWVYGPRRRTRSLLHTLIRDALNTVPTIIDHDGSYCVQMIHVDDVVSALIAAYDAEEVRGQAFNITGGVRIPMMDLARMVKDVLPKADFRFTSGKKLVDYHQELFDLTAAAEALKWRPQHGLREGIAQYAGWLAQHAY
jgi:UDP-glucuronate 4-epimerase